MQATDSLRVGVIIGSTRAQRFGPTVAAWFHSHARTLDADGAEAAATALLHQLTWWGRVLRDARATRACSH